MNLWTLIRQKIRQQRIRSEIQRLTAEEVAFTGRLLEESGRTMFFRAGLYAQTAWRKEKAGAAELVVYVLEDHKTSGINHSYRRVIGPVNEEDLLEAKKKALKLTHTNRKGPYLGLWPG